MNEAYLLDAAARLAFDLELASIAPPVNGSGHCSLAGLCTGTVVSERRAVSRSVDLDTERWPSSECRLRRCVKIG